VRPSSMKRCVLHIKDRVSQPRVDPYNLATHDILERTWRLMEHPSCHVAAGGCARGFAATTPHLRSPIAKPAGNSQHVVTGDECQISGPRARLRKTANVFHRLRGPPQWKIQAVQRPSSEREMKRR
jgi:hypothetical protein